MEAIFDLPVVRAVHRTSVDKIRGTRNPWPTKQQILDGLLARPRLRPSTTSAEAWNKACAEEAEHVAGIWRQIERDVEAMRARDERVKVRGKRKKSTGSA